METKATFEAVKEAFDKLARTGKSTSIRAVQAVTGGSLTTVGEHLAKIREELIASHPRSKMPPDFLAEVLKPVAQKIWDRAEEEQARSYDERFNYQVSAQIGLTEENRELSALNENLERQLQEVRSSLAAMENAIEVERGRIRGLDKALEDAEEALKTAQRDLATERVARENAEQSAVDLRSSNEQFQEIISMLKGMQSAKLEGS